VKLIGVVHWADGVFEPVLECGCGEEKNCETERKIKNGIKDFRFLTENKKCEK